MPKVSFAKGEFVNAEDSKRDVDGEVNDPPSDDTFHFAGSDEQQSIIKKHFVDERGFIQVGRQPMAPAIQANWGRKENVSSKIKAQIGLVFNVDKKIKIRKIEELNAEITAINYKVINSLSLYNSNKVTWVYNYTRINISFALGL